MTSPTYSAPAPTGEWTTPTANYNHADCVLRSLCTLAIRNAVVERLTQLAYMDEMSIQFLPRDILYILPSISKLSAFIYGVIYLSKLTSDSYPTTEKDIAIAKTKDSADVKWQTILQSKETVTEISQGEGIPLIILHGTTFFL